MATIPERARMRSTTFPPSSTAPTRRVADRRARAIRTHRPIALLGAFVLGALGASASGAGAQRTTRDGTAERSAAWAAVDQALGRKGTMLPGGVVKYGFPRSDLQVTLDGVHIAPALALGGWVAFRPTSRGEVMAMGDLVLAADEVAPVMEKLQAGGVQQTAVHNHLLGEEPRVMYMHVMAVGPAARIAQTLRAALDATKTPMPSQPSAPASAPIDLDTAAIASALGFHGTVNGGVYQVSVPRAERITEMGVEVPPSMGVATGINFQPTGGGKAAITGDFVLVGREVNPVIRALRAHGIRVTALHSHMLDETPRLFFMHFWADDDAVTLARGLRAALDEMHVKRS